MVLNYINQKKIKRNIEIEIQRLKQDFNRDNIDYTDDQLYNMIQSSGVDLKKKIKGRGNKYFKKVCRN